MVNLDPTNFFRGEQRCRLEEGGSRWFLTAALVRKVKSALPGL